MDAGKKGTFVPVQLEKSVVLADGEQRYEKIPIHFTQAQHYDQLDVWLDHPMLKSGLVLIDAPGLCQDLSGSARKSTPRQKSRVERLKAKVEPPLT